MGGLGSSLRPHRTAMTIGVLASLLGAASCGQLIDIDDWRDPPAADPNNPTCADYTKNGLETDVDCGGDSCWPCAKSMVCQNDADCDSGNCASGHCGDSLGKVCPPEPDRENPTCADCAMNGLETDVDCGGDSCAPCPAGLGCSQNVDCASGLCDGGRCADSAPFACVVDPDNASCGDCIKNGLETDVDCGGDACKPCMNGQTCSTALDCATSNCQQSLCVDATEPTCSGSPDPDNPTCADCAKNGLETDVDCGGDACGPCEVGRHCLGDGDCKSAFCLAFFCY